SLTHLPAHVPTFPPAARQTGSTVSLRLRLRRAALWGGPCPGAASSRRQTARRIPALFPRIPTNSHTNFFRGRLREGTSPERNQSKSSRIKPDQAQPNAIQPDQG